MVASSRAFLALLAAAALACAARPVRALPVDHRFSIAAGQEQFSRLYESREIVVEPPERLDAEVLPSEEIRLLGRTEGRATVFVLGPALLSVWQVDVRAAGTPTPPPAPPAPSAAALAAARKACPSLVEEREAGRPVLSATVATDACRLAVRELVRDGPWLATELRLIFAPEVLQQQLRELEAATQQAGASEVKLAYLGATLVLSGKATAEERRRLLPALWRVATGRLPLDDRLEIIERAPPPPTVMTLEQAKAAGLLDDEPVPAPTEETR